ncbi:oxygen-independent coproporphyrinogen-III oxidase-like protein sll1917 [Cocos nucifera]|nr:oxygen-independent coproporphyrinogen-III oxidase-like protein sll1917 [Cocos nucifera]EHA8586410.1 oxygen-independent coproporphyrinogen-III oxidase-like protein sll1917 [Cocos nucifera]
MFFHSALLGKARILPHVPSFPNPPPRPPTVCKFSSSADIPTLPPPTSAYVHLPFCRKRCHYCDFPIIALGSSSSSSSPSQENDPRIANYIHLLLQEIEATKPASHDQQPLETVFFGGGTPSLVPPPLVALVLDALRSKFGMCTDPEISIEMDPGTFDRGRLEELLALGVNRVSLGVQAFQEELLRACGRAHGWKEVYEAIEIVTGCDGLENWSMDLISSLPHQTPEMWEESLSQVVDARPTHVSVYDLQVEQGTKFGQLYTPGEFPLPTETQSANFYKMASETLTKAGYSHYEISSYCKSGYECKHNLTYWQNRSFYGFGLGSTSYINGVRFSRPRRLKEYIDWVQKVSDGMVGHDATSVGSKDMAMDVVMLSLRTARGLDLSSFGRSFGDCLALSLCKALRPFVESGHVVAIDGDRKSLSFQDFEQQLNDDYEIGSKVAFIRLSDPDGFLLSNELISIAFGVISP